ncbi:hypothetical protein VE04_00443 [Pseudogymnoascus sp. 24MN13]|nr:hypothetical protein VE04_00443 [Pseudogymnoascus sp. 24MN13]
MIAYRFLLTKRSITITTTSNQPTNKPTISAHATNTTNDSHHNGTPTSPEAHPPESSPVDLYGIIIHRLNSSTASALDCDVPVPSIEHVDAADRHRPHGRRVAQSSGSRAGSPTPPPRLSGSPAFTETSAPVRESSASRSPSLSDDNDIPRPSPSASPVRAASNSDGQHDIEPEAPGGGIWSASPRPLARRSSVSGPAKPAPPSISGSGALYPASLGSKRSRDVEDDGAGARSSQRRGRSTSPGFGPRLSPASLPGDTGKPAPSQSPSVSGSRVLGSTSSGGKRSRDVEDDGAGDRSPQRRWTGSILAADPASASGSRVLRPTSSGGRRSRIVEVARPSFLEVVLATPVTAVAPSVAKPVVAPSGSAVDAAGTTDYAGLVDFVAAPAQPVALVVVAPVKIVDLAPALGPAAAVAVPVAAVANPGPLPDRAEVRLRARIDALFASGRGRPRAQRSAMYRSLESLVSRDERILDLQAWEHA